MKIFIFRTVDLVGNKCVIKTSRVLSTLVTQGRKRSHSIEQLICHVFVRQGLSNYSEYLWTNLAFVMISCLTNIYHLTQKLILGEAIWPHLTHSLLPMRTQTWFCFVFHKSIFPRQWESKLDSVFHKSLLKRPNSHRLLEPHLYDVFKFLAERKEVGS